MLHTRMVCFLLCVLVGCSAKEPNAEEIAGILSARNNSVSVDASEINKLSCKKFAEEYRCEFLLHGQPVNMRLVQVGGGSFSALR